MKLIETREITLEDIIPCPILKNREDVGNLDEITGEIFTPIIVRPSKTQEGKFELITGYRRLKKAEKDKKEKILCLVYEQMTNEEAILVHAKENSQRKPLNVIEEGEEYQNMLSQLKVTQEQLAKIFTGAGNKTSQEKINNTIRLLKLAKPVQNYLALNKLGIGKGLLLLQIKDEKTQRDLADEFVKNNYTDEKAEARITQFKQQLTDNKARGQYMLHTDGSCYLPSPEIIKPAPAKIKLQLIEPNCPRVIEMIYEGEKLQCNNSETCPTCPAENICMLFVRLHDELERKQKDER